MSRPIWTFVEIETVGGRGVITDWVKGIGDEAEEEFHGVLRKLEVSPRDLWTRPPYDVFNPEFGEIRFKANRLQHRVFGFFLIEVKQFVMLIGATKKMNNYTPRDAVKSASKRRTLVQKDRSQLRVYTDHQF